MSDLAIIVRNNGKYEDGDPIVLLNDRRIKQVHAEHICHPNNFGLTKNRLRPTGTLSDYYFSQVYEFIFQRIFNTQIMRTNLWTGDQDVLSDVPNLNNESIHVKAFIDRQLKFNNHNIFGEKGAEYWYGGNYRPTKIKINAVWKEIEKVDGRKEKDHDKWPFSSIEKKEYLLLSTEDMEDNEVGEFLSREKDNDGNYLKYRKYKVNWRDIISDHASVLNRDIESDFRSEIRLKNILKMKKK